MATNTIPTKQTHTAANNSSGNTSGPYAISFDYLSESDVEVRVGNTLKTQITHYTFPTRSTIQFTAGNFPTLGSTIEIKRNTNITIPKVDFEDGSVLTESDLDNNSKHLLFGMQETKEDTESLVSTFVSANAPTGISNGARWYDTVSGRTFIYYVDVDTAQWVEASPPFDATEAVTTASQVNFVPSGTGAVTRTVDSKLKDVVNVADFGATGNGSTNDTAAIQAAIDSLGDNGGVVEFNVGTFLINATLNLTKKIHLVGKGGYFLNQFVDDQFTVGGTTIKLDNGSNTDMLKVQLDDASVGSDYRSHCSIRNIHFFGNRSNKQNPTNTTSGTVLNSSGNGIVISGVRYVTLENVIVTKCAEDGLKLQTHTYSSGEISTNNIDIRACAFHSNGQNGASLFGGDSIMDSCTVGYNGNNGITTVGFGVISNSLIWDNFDNGIFVQGTLENVTIVGNKIYDNDHAGIYLNDAADVATTNKTATASITGNKIIRNGGQSSTANLGSDSSGIFVNTIATNELIINGNEIGNTDDLWDTSKSYTTGNRVINAGRLYEATASISSGGSAPTHTSGTTNNWEDKKTVQDYGIYFNKTETIIRGFAGNDITRNFTKDIFEQSSTNPIQPPFTGFKLLNQADFESTSNLAVNTTASSLFNVSAIPTMYIVFITHIGGNAGGWAVISGDDTSPRILTQDSNSSSSSSYIFEIDGQSVDVKTNTGSLTSVWKAYRVI